MDYRGGRENRPRSVAGMQNLANLSPGQLQQKLADYGSNVHSIGSGTGTNEHHFQGLLNKYAASGEPSANVQSSGIKPYISPTNSSKAGRNIEADMLNTHNRQGTGTFGSLNRHAGARTASNSGPGLTQMPSVVEKEEPVKDHLISSNEQLETEEDEELAALLYVGGSNGQGQLGLGDKQIGQMLPSLTPLSIFNKVHNSVAKVSCGQRHAAIVTQARQLFTMGSNRQGQLGINLPQDNSHVMKQCTFPMLVDSLAAFQVVDVACGKDHTLAIVTSQPHKNKNKYNVYSWGSNSHGQLGLLTQKAHVPNPTQVSFDRQESESVTVNVEIGRISAGGHHSLFLDSTLGAVFGSGSNSHGQLGNNISSAIDGLPVRLNVCSKNKGQKSNIVQIACGYKHSLLLTFSGKVYESGEVPEGFTSRSDLHGGRPDAFDLNKANKASVRDEFKQVPGLRNVHKIAAGSHSAAIDCKGILYIWGTGTSFGTFPRPFKISQNKDFTEEITSVQVGDDYGLARDKAGRVYTWGRQVLQEEGDPQNQHLLKQVPLYDESAQWELKVDQLAAGYDSIFVSVMPKGAEGVQSSICSKQLNSIHRHSIEERQVQQCATEFRERACEKKDQKTVTPNNEPDATRTFETNSRTISPKQPLAILQPYDSIRIDENGGPVPYVPNTTTVMQHLSGDSSTQNFQPIIPYQSRFARRVYSQDLDQEQKAPTLKIEHNFVVDRVETEEFDEQKPNGFSMPSLQLKSYEAPTAEFKQTLGQRQTLTEQASQPNSYRGYEAPLLHHMLNEKQEISPQTQQFRRDHLERQYRAETRPENYPIEEEQSYEVSPKRFTMPEHERFNQPVPVLQPALNDHDRNVLVSVVTPQSQYIPSNDGMRARSIGSNGDQSSPLKCEQVFHQQQNISYQQENDRSRHNISHKDQTAPKPPRNTAQDSRSVSPAPENNFESHCGSKACQRETMRMHQNLSVQSGCGNIDHDDSSQFQMPSHMQRSGAHGESVGQKRIQDMTSSDLGCQGGHSGSWAYNTGDREQHQHSQKRHYNHQRPPAKILNKQGLPLSASQTTSSLHKLRKKYKRLKAQAKMLLAENERIRSQPVQDPQRSKSLDRKKSRGHTKSQTIDELRDRAYKAESVLRHYEHEKLVQTKRDDCMVRELSQLEEEVNHLRSDLSDRTNTNHDLEKEIINLSTSLQDRQHHINELTRNLDLRANECHENNKETTVLKASNDELNYRADEIAESLNQRDRRLGEVLLDLNLKNELCEERNGQLKDLLGYVQDLEGQNQELIHKIDRRDYNEAQDYKNKVFDILTENAASKAVRRPGPPSGQYTCTGRGSMQDGLVPEPELQSRRFNATQNHVGNAAKRMNSMPDIVTSPPIGSNRAFSGATNQSTRHSYSPIHRFGQRMQQQQPVPINNLKPQVLSPMTSQRMSDNRFNNLRAREAYDRDAEVNALIEEKLPQMLDQKHWSRQQPHPRLHDHQQAPPHIQEARDMIQRFAIAQDRRSQSYNSAEPCRSQSQLTDERQNPEFLSQSQPFQNASVHMPRGRYHAPVDHNPPMRIQELSGHGSVSQPPPLRRTTLGESQAEHEPVDRRTNQINNLLYERAQLNKQTTPQPSSQKYLPPSGIKRNLIPTQNKSSRRSRMTPIQSAISEEPTHQISQYDDLSNNQPATHPHSLVLEEETYPTISEAAERASNPKRVQEMQPQGYGLPGGSRYAYPSYDNIQDVLKHSRSMTRGQREPGDDVPTRRQQRDLQASDQGIVSPQFVSNADISQDLSAHDHNDASSPISMQTKITKAMMQKGLEKVNEALMNMKRDRRLYENNQN